MSKYEEEIILHNIKIKGQIKRLQSEIKPVENPIIAKILPFLPYDVNKNILDKLDIQKQIYLLEKKFYGLFKTFINNRLSFYTDTDRLYNKIYYYEENIINMTGLTLKQKILEKWDIRVFDYPNSNTYNILERLRNIKFVNIYNSTDNYDLKKSLDKMTYKYEKIFEILGDKMFEDLRPLSNINEDRTNKTIYFWNEFYEEQYRFLQDTYLEDNISNMIISDSKFAYKIFKSNGAINRKQFDRLIENVKLLVLDYQNKIEDILYSD